MICLIPSTINADALSTAVKNQQGIIKYRQTEFDRPQVNWYWEKIREIASSEFQGMDMEVSFTPGYKFGGDDKGVMIGASIPLYSKEKKMARRQGARGFLDEGAKLCAQLETALRTYLIYQEAYSNYALLAQDEGMNAFEKLVSTQTKIVETESLITQTHRQLQTLISPFDKNVKIFSWDKVGGKQ